MSKGLLQPDGPLPGAARGDRAALTEGGLESAECLQRGIRPGMLVPLDGHWLALGHRHDHRHDLLGEAVLLDGRHGAAMALEREGILVLARDTALLGHVLAGLAHRMRVVHLGQARVGEAPAEGGVEQLAVAAVVGALGLGHDVGRASHRLHATGDEGIAVAGPDGVGRAVDGLQAGSAQPIDGLAGHADG